MRPDVSQLVIGTYTDLPAPSGARGVGIVGCGISREGFGSPKVLASLRNPSYLALSPGGRYLYAVSETDDGEIDPSGTVTAFARDRSGDLTVINSSSSGGSGLVTLASLQRRTFSWPRTMLPGRSRQLP